MERTEQRAVESTKKITTTVICNNLDEAATFANNRAANLEGGAFINNYIQPESEEIIGYKVIPRSKDLNEPAIIYKSRKKK